MAFAADLTSDQKRLVRGEHLLMARRLLRARDEVHHAEWRVLMLAGSTPGEEIGAIRAIMNRARITAVDIDASCCDEARRCGADEVLNVNLFDWDPPLMDRTPRVGPGRPGRPKTRRLFDLIDLDLCSNDINGLRRLSSIYRQRLEPSGVMMMTFSYGRDVVEATESWLARIESRRRSRGRPLRLGTTEDFQAALLVDLRAASLPRMVIARILRIIGCGARGLASVMMYAGNKMPMCSLLLSKGRYYDPVSVVSVQDKDLELALLHDYPDPQALYACPRERVEAFKRSAAARKAAETLRQRRTAQAKDTNRYGLLPPVAQGPNGECG